MPQLFSNAAKSTLNAGVLVGDTTLTLADNGAAFPVANRGTGTSGDWFKAVLDNGTNLEVVYVRTHTSGSTTFSNVLRGQEGTTAYAFNAGATVGLRLTSQDFALVQSEKIAPTVADLKAANLSVGDFVSTLGYYTPGDGGGATYEIVAADAVVGYDEPNLLAYNLFPPLGDSLTSLTGWDRTGIAAYGSGSSGNALVAPNGLTEADYIAETAVTSGHTVNRQNTNTTASFFGPQEVSVYAAKPSFAPAARQYAYLMAHVGNPPGGTYYPWNFQENRVTAVFDLESASVAYSLFGANMTNASATATDVGNGWVLLRIRYTPPTNLTGWLNFSLGVQIAAGTTGYLGDVTKGGYFWGWGIRPLITPVTRLNNTLQAKPLLNTEVRLSQLGAASGSDNNALLAALSHFGSNPGTLVVDRPTVFTQPSSLTSLTIPSNVDLRFENNGALTGVTNMTVNSQLTADNRAILPKGTSVTFGPRQRSVLSNWFGL